MRIVEIIDKHLALLGFICKVHASSLGEGLEGRKSKALDGPVVHLQEVVVDDHLDLASAARPLVQPKLVFDLAHVPDVGALPLPPDLVKECIF